MRGFKRRSSALVVCLAMMVSLFSAAVVAPIEVFAAAPTMVIVATGVNQYWDLVTNSDVDSTGATDPSAYASYNDSTSTLTLSGNIANSYTNGSTSAGIYANGDLKIVVATGDTVTVNHGIYVSGNLDIEIADGATLTSGTDGESVISGTSRYGIYSYSNISISGTGTVNATAANSEETLGFAYYFYGIFCKKNLTISGSTVVAKSSDWSGEASDDVRKIVISYGISASENVTINNNASVTATGGELTEKNTTSIVAVSAGINADRVLTINNATVDATGGSAKGGFPQGNSSFGLYSTEYGYSDVIISGSSNVTAVGGESNQDSIGISSKKITYNGGMMVAGTIDNDITLSNEFAFNIAPTLNATTGTLRVGADRATVENIATAPTDTYDDEKWASLSTKVTMTIDDADYTNGARIYKDGVVINEQSVIVDTTDATTDYHISYKDGTLPITATQIFDRWDDNNYDGSGSNSIFTTPDPDFYSSTPISNKIDISKLTNGNSQLSSAMATLTSITDDQLFSNDNKVELRSNKAIAPVPSYLQRLDRYEIITIDPHSQQTQANILASINATSDIRSALTGQSLILNSFVYFGATENVVGIINDYTGSKDITTATDAVSAIGFNVTGMNVKAGDIVTAVHLTSLPATPGVELDGGQYEILKGKVVAHDGTLWVHFYTRSASPWVLYATTSPAPAPTPVPVPENSAAIAPLTGVYRKA